MRIAAKRINPDFTAEHAARIRPELTEVPSCYLCGNVPIGGYCRFQSDAGRETIRCLRCPNA